MEVLKKKALKFQLPQDKKLDLQEIKEINSKFSSTSDSDVEFDPDP